MILVDTSIWVDHIHHQNQILVQLLEENSVFIHPWIIGELALGSIKQRTEFIELLHTLPKLTPQEDATILTAIETHSLHSTGIRWVDASLFLSCLNYPCRLWTKDNKLKKLAERYKINV